MNETERRMVELLRELKKEYGLIAIKSEFETEGSRKDELTKLRDIISKAGLMMYIKIGGCEAVRDLDDCKIFGADGIMAPMIETPFAVSKFDKAFNKVFSSEDSQYIDKIINLETITAYNNMDAIFSKAEDFLDTVVIGRSDFTASLGLDKPKTNSEKIFNYCIDIIKKSKDYGFTPAIGGNISVNSIDFIKRLGDSIERLETRKIVFEVASLGDNHEIAIQKSIEFEYLYLKNKLNYYKSIVNEDNDRFNDLKNRVDVEL